MCEPLVQVIIPCGPPHGNGNWAITYELNNELICSKTTCCLDEKHEVLSSETPCVCIDIYIYIYIFPWMPQVSLRLGENPWSEEVCVVRVLYVMRCFCNIVPGTLCILNPTCRTLEHKAIVHFWNRSEYHFGQNDYRFDVVQINQIRDHSHWKCFSITETAFCIFFKKKKNVMENTLRV